MLLLRLRRRGTRHRLGHVGHRVQVEVDKVLDVVHEASERVGAGIGGGVIGCEGLLGWLGPGGGSARDAVFGPDNELGKVALLLAGAGGHAGGG